MQILFLILWDRDIVNDDPRLKREVIRVRELRKEFFFTVKYQDTKQNEDSKNTLKNEKLYVITKSFY